LKIYIDTLFLLGTQNNSSTISSLKRKRSTLGRMLDQVQWPYWMRLSTCWTIGVGVLKLIKNWVGGKRWWRCSASWKPDPNNHVVRRDLCDQAREMHMPTGRVRDRRRGERKRNG